MSDMLIDDVVKAAPFPRRYGRGIVLYGVVCLAVALATVLVSALDPFKDPAMIFVIPVLFAALYLGLGPSIAASVLGAFCYNFFFLTPRYSLKISDPSDAVALFVFLGVALIISNLVSQIQRQTQEQAEQARISLELYGFSRSIAAIANLDDLIGVVTAHMGALLECSVMLLLPRQNELELRGSYPVGLCLSKADISVALRVWTRQSHLEYEPDSPTESLRLFIPLLTKLGRVGVLGIGCKTGFSWSVEERRLLDSLSNQTAVAIERIQLAENVNQVRLEAESEKLRNAVLASLSHDLRTPLVGIIGGLSSLATFFEQYDPATAQELISVALRDAERLHRYVENLLNLTKLESGGLRVKCEPNDVDEIIHQAIRRVQPMLGNHALDTTIPADLPMANVDFVLLEQTLFNLLDNAIKYTPSGSHIQVVCGVQGQYVVIKVCDNGPGIPQQDLERIFTKFTRAHTGSGQSSGTGLGLVICQGFVVAMGGRIVAANQADGSGAVFSIYLPLQAMAGCDD